MAESARVIHRSSPMSETENETELEIEIETELEMLRMGSGIQEERGAPVTAGNELPIWCVDPIGQDLDHKDMAMV